MYSLLVTPSRNATPADVRRQIANPPVQRPFLGKMRALLVVLGHR